MSEEFSQLVAPLVEVVELFSETDKNAIVTKTTFEQAIADDRVNQFYSELARRLAEYQRQKNLMNGMRSKLRAYYSSLLAFAAVLASVGWLVLIVTGVLLARKRGWEALSSAPLIFIGAFAILTGVMLIHMAVVYRSHGNVMADRRYRTDLEEPELNKLEKLLKISSDGVVSGNYVIYIYLSTYHDNAVEWDNNPCPACAEEGKCTALADYATHCFRAAAAGGSDVASLVAKHFTDLVAAVDYTFNSLDLVRDAVDRLNHRRQTQDAVRAMRFVQAFMLKALKDQAAPATLTGHELQRVVKEKIVPLLTPAYGYVTHLRPDVSERDHVQQHTTDTSETACMLMCVGKPECSMAFYEAAGSKCTTYTKRDDEPDPTFSVWHSPADEVVTLVKKTDTLSRLSTKGCVSQAALTKLKERGEHICLNDYDCARYLLDNQLQQSYGSVVHDAARQFGSCAGADNTNTTVPISVVQPLSDIVEDDTARTLMVNTLVKFKDVVASQVTDMVLRYGSRVSLPAVQDLALVELKTRLSKAVFDRAAGVYADIFSLVREKAEAAHLKEMEEEQQRAATSEVISYTDFRAKFVSMSEADFVETFCHELNVLKDSSRSLTRFFKKHELTLEASAQTIAVYGRLIRYGVAFAVMLLVMYVTFDVKFILAKPALAGQKYLLIMGILVLLFSFAYAHQSKMESVHGYNEHVIRDNGNIIKSAAQAICVRVIGSIPELQLRCSEQELAARADAIKKADLAVLRDVCDYSTTKMLPVNESTELVLQDLYTQMVRMTRSIQECNSVLFLGSVKLPFPYFEVWMNAVMVLICAGIVVVILSRFKVISRFQDIKTALTVKSKLQRGLAVSSEDLLFYTRDDAFDMFTRNFAGLAGLLFFVGLVIYMSFKMSESSKQFKSGLFNSDYYQNKKCYKL